jgi:trans-2,3-dihydro-3-hydroxyanthranilate isomerase
MDLDIDLGPASELHDYYVLDVFTDTRLAGNPLAVFSDGERFDERTMQLIARELNLSETVFVLAAEHGGDARARIFTPAAELPFAGHPTLGTAVLIATAWGLDHVRLETAGGIVPVAIERRPGAVTFGRMQQPIPTWTAYQHETELLAALGVERSLLPVEAYTNGPLLVSVVLESEQEVAALAPDMARLAALGPTGFSVVAAIPGPRPAWKSRHFVPGLGIDEDPATGGAAGPLAVHLARHGLIAFGEEIEIQQGAEIGRPSRLYARATGDREQIERVEVAGNAVIVARGTFRLPARRDGG